MKMLPFSKLKKSDPHWWNLAVHLEVSLSLSWRASSMESKTVCWLITAQFSSELMAMSLHNTIKDGIRFRNFVRSNETLELLTKPEFTWNSAHHESFAADSAQIPSAQHSGGHPPTMLRPETKIHALMRLCNKEARPSKVQGIFIRALLLTWWAASPNPSRGGNCILGFRKTAFNGFKNWVSALLDMPFSRANLWWDW